MRLSDQNKCNGSLLSVGTAAKPTNCGMLLGRPWNGGGENLAEAKCSPQLLIAGTEGLKKECAGTTTE